MKYWWFYTEWLTKFEWRRTIKILTIIWWLRVCRQSPKFCHCSLILLSNVPSLERRCVLRQFLLMEPWCCFSDAINFLYEQVDRGWEDKKAVTDNRRHHSDCLRLSFHSCCHLQTCWLDCECLSQWSDRKVWPNAWVINQRRIWITLQICSVLFVWFSFFRYKPVMSVMVWAHRDGSLFEAQREGWTLKRLILSHGALLSVCPSFKPCASPPNPHLMFDVFLLFLPAAGERTDALSQAAECTDRPGLPQTQTGR